MFDAIVVGARCGGSPTAMLLARGGYRVLLVDRATFPSDIVSTHFIWPPGVACLKRWGLLERVLATNCPIIRTIGLDLGEFQLTGNPPPIDGVAEMCAPRRTLLDKLLLDAAAEAGTEVREGFTVAGLTSSGGRVTGIRGHAKGGREIAEQARIVIGADGRNSLVARAAGAEEYNVRPILTCVCYAYWRDVAPHIPAIHPLPRRVVINFPSNDGLTVTGVIFPRDELTTVRSSLERHLLESLGQVANLAEPFRGGARVERIRGMGDLPNFFRKPYGDGWALVGDAGYHKDPILGQGISDAFGSAELAGGGGACRIFRCPTARRGIGGISARSRPPFWADVRSLLQYGSPRSPATRDAGPVPGAARQPRRARLLFRDIGGYGANP